MEGMLGMVYRMNPWYGFLFSDRQSALPCLRVEHLNIGKKKSHEAGTATRGGKAHLYDATRDSYNVPQIGTYCRHKVNFMGLVGLCTLETI